MTAKADCLIRPFNQYGYALPLVLGISLVIGMITLSITNTLRQQMRLSLELQDRQAADLLTYSAWSKLQFVLLRSTFSATGLVPHPEAADMDLTHWNLYGEPFQLTEHSTLRLQDTGGMLSPLFHGEVIRGVLGAMGVSSEIANRFADTLADWQDADDFTRLNGAEAWDYRAAGYPYTPRNFYIQTLAELELLLEYDREALAPLNRHLTYWHSGNLNYMLMDADLLAVFVPDAERLSAVLEMRAAQSLDRRFFTALTGIIEDEEQFFWPSGMLQVTIETQVNRSVARIQALLHKRADHDAPLRVLEWTR